MASSLGCAWRNTAGLLVAGGHASGLARHRRSRALAVRFRRGLTLAGQLLPSIGALDDGGLRALEKEVVMGDLALLKWEIGLLLGWTTARLRFLGQFVRDRMSTSVLLESLSESIRPRLAGLAQHRSGEVVPSS